MLQGNSHGDGGNIRFRIGSSRGWYLGRDRNHLEGGLQRQPFKNER